MTPLVLLLFHECSFVFIIYLPLCFRTFSLLNPFNMSCCVAEVVVEEVDMEVVEIGVEIAIGTEALDPIDISMVEIDLVLTERFSIGHFM